MSPERFIIEAAVTRETAGRPHLEHERCMKGSFSDCSIPAPRLLSFYRMTRMERVMAEFVRSGLIVLMGMTVMAAGILVVFYG